MASFSSLIGMPMVLVILGEPESQKDTGSSDGISDCP